MYKASHKSQIPCSQCQSKHKGIFCELESVPLAEVGHNKVMNNYKKGHVIFHQGNPPYGLYCVNSGKIKISKLGNEGKESIIRIAGPGDVLGHRSLFSNESYSVTATALEDSTICFIDKHFIYKSINEQPSISLNLIQKLSREMGSVENKAAGMFQKNVRERLAELLLMFKKNYATEEKGRTKLDIKLTREEMASMVGTTSETIIRFITEFKEEGILEQDGKIIYIIDEKKLLDFANLQH